MGWLSNPNTIFITGNKLIIEAPSNIPAIKEQISIKADLFGEKPDNYALVPSVSYGMNTAARAIESKLKKGDQILLIDEDFPIR